MNNFYVLVHLARHLEGKLQESRFLYSYSPHRDVWESYLAINNDNIIRIVFSSNPSETSLFLDKYRSRKKSNVTTFFEEVENDIITGVRLAENDRYISLMLKSGKKILFRLFGNNPNVFLIHEQIIKESFKSGSDTEGKPEPEPRPARKPAGLPADDLSAKQKITKLFPKFPRHLIGDVIDHFKLENKTSEEVRAKVSELVDAMLNNPEFRVLTDGNLCLIPESLLPVPADKKFDNVNDAVRHAYYNTSRQRRLSARLKTIKPKIEQAIRKAESAIEQLEQAGKGLERAEQYEQFGHILMAHAHEKLPPGAEEITLPDFYNNNEPVKIPMKQGMSIAENAEHYYSKSAKAIRNVEESKKRLKGTIEELNELNALLDSINSIDKIYEFDDWFEAHKENLENLGVLSGSTKAESLPYRQLEIDGYEIWVGRNARSNDRLTSDAHKEDVWLHARGVSGSHVVIRMGNRKDMPPSHVIAKAASVAAWNSKARGSSLVPVIITKRKYINKPKGAPPGTVTVQREQVEMVQPQKSVS
jgi:predicted ribosome quality control (RQC) complex YloA/Tae2 family protein